MLADDLKIELQKVDDLLEEITLKVEQGPSGLQVNYQGDANDEGWAAFTRALARPNTRGQLAALRLGGADEGCNGTRNWDLAMLLKAGPLPNLRSLCIQQNVAGNHNRIIVARIYDEDGALAQLLRCAPHLRSLVSPSAPNPEFFELEPHALESLDTDCGYAHEDFILNLARCDRFPQLKHLSFGEYSETYMDDFREQCVPTEHYEAFFASPVAARLQSFTWRNSILPDEEIRALHALCPQLKLTVTRP